MTPLQQLREVENIARETRLKYESCRRSRSWGHSKLLALVNADGKVEIPPKYLDDDDLPVLRDWLIRLTTPAPQ